jgi:hypothetical protein
MDNHVLFYSNNCKYSVEVLQRIRDTEYADKVVKICIDTVDKSKIPPYITSVPTILLTGTMRQLKGEELFQWITENVKESPTNNTGIQPYEFNDMSMISDNYSTLDGNDINSNFALTSGENVPFKGEENTKVDESKLSRSLEQYMSERDADMSIPDPIKRI